MSSEKMEIKSRTEISFLVRTFYAKVRKDEMLGNIFNSIIKDWETHLEKLTDFWETNLLFVQKFKGNPLTAHQKADETLGYSITPKHFGQWLHLWYSTIDEHFVGENAQIAKNRARNMSSFMFIKIFQNRPEAFQKIDK